MEGMQNGALRSSAAFVSTFKPELVYFVVLAHQRLIALAVASQALYDACCLDRLPQLTLHLVLLKEGSRKTRCPD